MAGWRMHYGHPDFVETWQPDSAKKISELQNFSLLLKESYDECHFHDAQTVESSLHGPCCLDLVWDVWGKLWKMCCSNSRIDSWGPLTHYGHYEARPTSGFLVTLAQIHLLDRGPLLGSQSWFHESRGRMLWFCSFAEILSRGAD